MVTYEWCCEVADTHGDTVDLLFASTFADAARLTAMPTDDGQSYCVALHRHKDADGYRITTCAYVVTADGDYWRGVTDTRDGVSLEPTCSIDGDYGTATPARFVDEVRRARALERREERRP